MDWDTLPTRRKTSSFIQCVSECHQLPLQLLVPPSELSWQKSNHYTS
jgi:hypothetical protein